MTDEQLKDGNELKRKMATLEGEIEKFNVKSLPEQGINVYLPNVGTLIEDVKQVFEKHLKEFNDKFKRL